MYHFIIVLWASSEKTSIKYNKFFEKILFKTLFVRTGNGIWYGHDFIDMDQAGWDTFIIFSWLAFFLFKCHFRMIFGLFSN